MEDHETLPAQVAARAPDTCVYNYAFPGYGTQQMLGILENWDLREQIAEPTGTFVYVFIPPHVRRTLGTMRLTTWWVRNQPCYLPDEAGIPRHRGTFVTARPWRMWIYDLMAREQVYRFFDGDWPPRITQKHLSFVGDIVEAAAARAEVLFPGCDFWVVLFPQPYKGRSYAPDDVAAAFSRRDIQILDYTDAMRVDPQHFYLPVDLHPKPAAYSEVADWLVKDLGLINMPSPGPSQPMGTKD